MARFEVLQRGSGGGNGERGNGSENFSALSWPFRIRNLGFIGVHSVSLEREKSTGGLANSSRELANLSRELAKSKRELVNLKPSIYGFDQLYPGNRRNSFTILRLTAERIIILIVSENLWKSLRTSQNFWGCFLRKSLLAQGAFCCCRLLVHLLIFVNLGRQPYWSHA